MLLADNDDFRMDDILASELMSMTRHPLLKVVLTALSKLVSDRLLLFRVLGVGYGADIVGW